MIRVSVITPTRNRADLLVHAIESVRAQTLEAWELIVVDDGSTDHTAEAVRGIGDPRVVYLRSTGSGCSAARNLGMQRARGEFIAFLDDDDEYLPHKLALHTEFLDRHPDVDLVGSGTRLVEPSGGKIADLRPWLSPEPLDLAGCLKSCRFQTCSIQFRRALIEAEKGRFRPGLDRAEDALFYIELARRGCRMSWAPSIVAQYRVDPARNASAVVAYDLSFHREVDRLLSEEDVRAEVLKRADEIEADRCFLSGMRAGCAGAVPFARKWLKRAYTLCPGAFGGARSRFGASLRRFISQYGSESLVSLEASLRECLLSETHAILAGLARADVSTGEPMNYQAFGLTIASEFELDECPAGDRAVEDADLTIWRTHLGDIESGSRGVGEARIFVRNFGSFIVREGRQILVDAVGSAADPILVSFIMEKLIPLALIQRGCLVFHGSVVELKGRALALIGPPGVGKTSLAMALRERHGCRLLDDDIAVLKEEAGGLRVYPGWSMMKLWPDTAIHYGLDPCGLPQQWAETEKRVRRLEPEQMAPGVPLDRMLLLERGVDEGQIGLSGADALRSIMPHWYGALYHELVEPAGGPARMFADAAAVARHARIEKCCIGEGLPKLEVWAERIVKTASDGKEQSADGGRQHHHCHA